MGSEWAKQADRQAEAMTGELVGLGGEVLVIYQRREARFALKAGETTTYFSAHDYEGKKGMDWRQLRADILARVKQVSGAGRADHPKAASSEES